MRYWLVSLVAVFFLLGDNCNPPPGTDSGTEAAANDALTVADTVPQDAAKDVTADTSLSEAGISDALVVLDTAVDIYVRACAKLAKLGCKDFTNGHCADVMRNAASSGHYLVTPSSVNCLLGASVNTAAAVSKCAGFSCM